VTRQRRSRSHKRGRNWTPLPTHCSSSAGSASATLRPACGRPRVSRCR